MLKFQDRSRKGTGYRVLATGQGKVAGFTLTEIMIAVSIFSIISTIVAGLYIQSFRESARANNQNQVYEDARFILQQIGNEIRDGAIDYDEYYNQNVVLKSVEPPKSAPFGTVKNYGQNFGRYYSSFFNPGDDDALGFDCNKDDLRNKNDCIPLRRTIDRNTGSNPFSGKYGENPVEENAFCGKILYSLPADELPNIPPAPPCNINPPPQTELYLISKDSSQKTILAREKIGDSTYALSILRLKGSDIIDKDGIPDTFVCADEFNCSENNLPRLDTNVGGDDEALGDLNEGESANDLKSDGFSKDFVPISPLRVNIEKLQFYISPSDDPHYAFAEETSANQMSRVRIFLTVSGIGNNASNVPPVTLVETVPTQILTPIKAPITVYPKP